MIVSERPILNAHARFALEDALEALAQETIETGKAHLWRKRRVIHRAPSQQRQQFQRFYEKMLKQVRHDYGIEDGGYLYEEQRNTLESLRAYAIKHQLHEALSRGALRRIHAMLMRQPELHQALHHIRDEFHEDPSMVQNQQTPHSNRSRDTQNFR